VFLIAASVLLLLASGYYMYRLNGKLSVLENTVVSMSHQKDSLSQTLYTWQTKQQETEKALALFKDPANKTVELKGLAKSPDSKATIVWNKVSKEVYINIEKLPPPPENMEYQLWALMDGKPIDAGMIEMTNDSTGMHKMKNIDQAQAFAITLEKKGGSPAPQGEMYAMGSI